MTVTEADIRRVAALARLRVPEGELERLTAQIDDILAHVSVLSATDTSATDTGSAHRAVGRESMPLREDTVDPAPMKVPEIALAARAEDGFILVPRLATHGSAAGDAAADGGAELDDSATGEPS